VKLSSRMFELYLRLLHEEALLFSARKPDQPTPPHPQPVTLTTLHLAPPNSKHHTHVGAEEGEE
jgi:hypothetical protein